MVKAVFVVLLSSSLLANAHNPDKVHPDGIDKARDLAGLSAALQAVVERASPAVVQITASGFSMAEGNNGAGTQILSRERGIGSGVLLSEDGLIVTNAHVIHNAHKVRVRLNGVEQKNGSARDLEAKLLGEDNLSDLALLKVEVKGAQHLQIADPGELKQGEIVLAFGSPLGFDNSVSMGLVSSAARQMSPDDPRVYIQTDAAINPGNSGGPLVNTRGQLVGINTFIMSQSGGSEGVGFAVPADIVQNVYVRLREDGRIRRGQVGLFVKTITPALAEALGIAQDKGVLLEDVIPGGPAERANLKVGDILLNFAGHSIDNVQQFARAIFQLQVGDSAAIEVLRGGNHIRASLTVDERHDAPQVIADRVSETSVVRKLGLLASTVDAETAATLPGLRVASGVLISARLSGSSYVGDILEPGDVIHSLNTHPIACIEDLQVYIATIKPDVPVVLQVERRGEMLFVLLEAG